MQGLKASTLAAANVRFGSKADMCSAKRHVRFTPNSGHLRCDRHVRFVPIADIAMLFDHFVGARKQRGGTVRPSALAVFRLITNSYLVGACTGRSAGFSPLRMRST